MGPGQTAALQITFAPTAAGTFSARVPLDFGQVFFETGLQGTGVRPPPQLALSAGEFRFDSVDFDRLPPVDGRETRTLTIANVGPGELRLDSLRVAGKRNARRQVRATATLFARVLDEPMRADFDGDGTVGFRDFFLFADGFGSDDPLFDLDSSGRVDFIDFFIFADYFGEGTRAKLLALARQRLGLPTESRLEQNFPTPFNASTALRYWLAEPGPVSLEVFDAQGQKVRALVEGFQTPGFHQVRWDGTDEGGWPVAAGLYLGRLRAGGRAEVLKMLLIK